MKTKLSDFTFRFRGYGHYEVMYTSPVTDRRWYRMITDMTIIDATKNADDYPKRKDLELLKRIVKTGKAY